MQMLHALANPARFRRVFGPVRPWLGAAAAVLTGVGLYMGLFASPPDYQQGESVRIMYVHVPSAWMALFCYAAMAGASAALLIWRHPLAGLAARAAAPVGMAFTALTLFTGSLWGKPMWGTWWVWDARLTSVLVLLFLYMGYIALANAFDDAGRGARAAAVLAVAGVINLPIVKFSVDWWNTLHQPASVLRMDGPSIHADMLWPLLLTAAGFTAFALWFILTRMERDLTLARIRALETRRGRDGRAQHHV
ncbi:MAG: heme ABC transporter permease CcmC [Rhodospirillales bacterium]